MTRLVRPSGVEVATEALDVELRVEEGYDSDQLDARLVKRGIEFIAPNRRTRRHKSQDGPQLRRYCRRWKIERLFGLLQNFRRLVTRYGRHVENVLGFVQLACIVILYRQFVK